MTWVLGTASIFGYGGMISDVRVTWPNGEHRDILQKVHFAGPMMLIGFAGSVRIGFSLVDDLRRCLQCPPDETWLPQTVVWRWWRRARKLFAAAPPAERALGSSVVISAVSPLMNGLFPHAHCMVMRSPAFAPTKSPPGNWASIGTGADHDAAQYFATRYSKDFITIYGQGDVHMGFGGAVFMTAGTVVHYLKKDPLASVSPVVQFSVVRRHGASINSFATTDYHPDGTTSEAAPGALATTWQEFLTATATSGQMGAACA